MARPLVVILVLIACGTASRAGLASDDAGRGPLYFERDIRPILKAHCFLCHGEE
jgi:cytochrome c553